MKALALTHYRTPLEWQSVDKPIPQADEVLVRIYGTSINPLDSMIQRGEIRALYSYTLPQIMGNDLSGVVEEVGGNVTDFKVGDAVFARPAMKHLGAFAQYDCVKSEDLAHAPSNVSLLDAAAVPLVSLTAMQAFTEKTHVQQGTKVFIQGGAGGLGSMALQVAKMLGATVAVTVGTADVQFARDLGADIVVDYKTQQYEDYVKNFDVVLDTLGGPEIERSMKILRKGGTLVSVVGDPDPNLADQIGKPYLKPVMYFLSRKERAAARRAGVTYKFLFMRANGQQLTTVAHAIEAGKIKPIISNTIPFDDLADAMNKPSRGHRNPGKTIVQVAEA